MPGSRRAAEIWKDGDPCEDLTVKRGYQNLLERGELDRCGVTLLAGKAVGAPFVGAVAACLALAEVLRQLHGGALHQVLDLDLQAIEHGVAVPHGRDFSEFNPGYLPAPMQR